MSKADHEGCAFVSDEDGETALHIAAEVGSYVAAKAIIDRLPENLPENFDLNRYFK